MKKIKYLLLTMCMLLLCTVTANAINKDFTSSSKKITLPIQETPNQYHIMVYGVTDYNLYAQWGKITKSEYDLIQEKLVTMGNAMTQLEAWEYEKPVSTDYDSNGEYQIALQPWSQTYNEYLAAYEDSVDAYYAAIPNWDDTKWESVSNNNTVDLPNGSSTGLQPYVLYIRIEDNENQVTEYAVQAYLVDITSSGSSDQESNQTEANATVGNVETSIYNAEITWTDLTFDWKYDSDQEKYRWYNDAHFSIKDKTTSGRIYPDIAWESTDNYQWTVGRFVYDRESSCELIDEEMFNSLKSQGIIPYTNSSCSSKGTGSDLWEENTWYYIYYPDSIELSSAQLPDDGRIQVTDPVSGEFLYYAYSVNFNLEIDGTKEMITPNAGDVIGTVTITINSEA